MIGRWTSHDGTEKRMEHRVQGKYKMKKPNGSAALSLVPTRGQPSENGEMQTADRWRHEGVAWDRRGVCRTVDIGANFGVNK